MFFKLIDYLLYDFVNCCYIGLLFEEMDDMLVVVGVFDLDVLIDDILL